MKKNLHKIIFVLGILVFLFPILGNRLSTRAYQSNINEYNEIIRNTDKELIKKEKEKVKKHNEKLDDVETNYVDVYSDNPTNENQASQSYYDALNLGSMIGSVEIPKINVDVPIYHGTSDKVLSKGAGHLVNSALPSSELGTHSVITAHRGLPSSKLFRNLDKMEIGDHFFVNVLDEKIAYEVKSIEIVLPQETTWLRSDQDLNKMTLLTCEPYMINTHRMLVTGHKISYTDEEQDININKKTNNDSLLIIAGTGLILLLSSATYIVYKKRRGADNQ